MDPINQSLIDAFRRRFACKRYDPQGRVSDEDLETLLEIARLSPSSWGMEPWKLLLVEDERLLERILECARGAKRNADRTVVVLARKKVDAQSPYAQHIWEDVQGRSEEEIEELRPSFDQLQRHDLRVADSARTLLDWARCQTYLLLGDMLFAAALLGVDSTPVEGYDAARLNALLAEEGVVDPEEFAVSVLVQFGKADPTHREHPKWRRPIQEVVERV